MERYEIATVADIEEIEKIPLEERLTVHNTYDMIKQGASIDPDAPAMSLILSGDQARSALAGDLRGVPGQGDPDRKPAP